MWRRLMTLVRSRTELAAERDRALAQALTIGNTQLEMAGLIIRLKLDIVGLRAQLDAREVELRERERKIARLRDHRAQLIALQGQGVLQ